MKKLLINIVGVAGGILILLSAFWLSLDTVDKKKPIVEVPVKSQPTHQPTEAVPAPTKALPVRKPTRKASTFSKKDAYLLMKIAMAEAEDEDTIGKALVMRVVLNRVKHKEFPNSIKKVIYQEKQFSPIANGRFDRVEPNEDSRKALDMIAEDEWDESGGALYFESKSDSTWHQDNLRFLFRHGNHYFYVDRK